MKIIATILLSVLLTEKINGQNELPVKDGQVHYEIIDSSVTGAASELHSKARMWIANSFKDSKAVIQVDDKESNSLMGKGNFIVSEGLATRLIQFSMKIDSKDNKYRAQIYNVKVGGTSGDNMRSAEWFNKKREHAKVKKKINDEMDLILASLKRAMAMSKTNDF